MYLYGGGKNIPAVIIVPCFVFIHKTVPKCLFSKISITDYCSARRLVSLVSGMMNMPPKHSLLSPKTPGKDLFTDDLACRSY